MSDSEDYNSESDEDYVPSDQEALSEEENSGDEEDLSLLKDSENDDQATGNKDKGKNDKSAKDKGKKEVEFRKGGIRLEGDENESEVKLGNEEEKLRKEELEKQIAKENEARKEEEEKKRVNDLWSSFLSDVGTSGTKSKSKTPSSTSTTAPLTSQSQPAERNLKKSVDTSSAKSGEKITVTKVFDFAGEEVKIQKEVDISSKEGQEELEKQKGPAEVVKEDNKPSPMVSASPGSTSLSLGGVKRPAVGGGLGSVLNKINKKAKISTLEKSKLDWNSFKDKEGISDDLALHNRGKQSYIERQNFLNRADYRQFEIEKNLRLSSSKR